MAQTVPAYRLLAERARARVVEARQRNAPDWVIAYLEENYQQWLLADKALSASQALIKSLGTGTKASELTQVLIAAADYNRHLIGETEP